MIMKEELMWNRVVLVGRSKYRKICLWRFSARISHNVYFLLDDDDEIMWIYSEWQNAKNMSVTFKGAKYVMPTTFWSGVLVFILKNPKEK